MPKNLKPYVCQGCGAHLAGWAGMTYIHGKWLCDRCQDREKKGLPLESSESVKEG